MRDKVVKGRCGMPKGDDHWNCKLGSKEIRQMKELKLDGVPMTEIARRFGVHYNTVRYVFNGRRRSH